MPSWVYASSISHILLKCSFLALFLLLTQPSLLFICHKLNPADTSTFMEKPPWSPHWFSSLIPPCRVLSSLISTVYCHLWHCVSLPHFYHWQQQVNLPQGSMCVTCLWRPRICLSLIPQEDHNGCLKHEYRDNLSPFLIVIFFHPPTGLCGGPLTLSPSACTFHQCQAFFPTLIHLPAGQGGSWTVSTPRTQEQNQAPAARTHA